MAAARLADRHGLPPFLPGYSVGNQMEHGGARVLLGGDRAVVVSFAYIVALAWQPGELTAMAGCRVRSGE